MVLSACATRPDVGSDLHRAIAVGLSRVERPAHGFVLTTFERLTDRRKPVRIYIEGDGRAWITSVQPSADPTPRHPLALLLAIEDRTPNVVYLARPCQYSRSRSRNCEPAYWTDRRFSREVVEAMNQVIDQILTDAGGSRIELVGYSGGAALAVLLAAKRKDVDSLRTVAGNLDTEWVNRYHRVSPMPESLNPIDVAERLQGLPQVHYIGDSDAVVRQDVAGRFLARQQQGCATVIAVRDATHETGWAAAWPALLEHPLPCADRLLIRE